MRWLAINNWTATTTMWSRRDGEKENLSLRKQMGCGNPFIKFILVMLTLALANANQSKDLISLLTPIIGSKINTKNFTLIIE